MALTSLVKQLRINAMRLFHHLASASLTIYGHLGRTVWSQQQEERQDALQVDLNNGTFQNGIYLVSVVSQGEMLTKRLVIAK